MVKTTQLRFDLHPKKLEKIFEVQFLLLSLDWFAT